MMAIQVLLYDFILKDVKHPAKCFGAVPIKNSLGEGETISWAVC